MTDPYTPAQLLELANAPTEEEGGPRDGDWMVEAAAALKDAARQIAERPVPTTELQEPNEPEIGVAGIAGTVEFGVVLDDAGSTDVYPTEAEARAHGTSETPLVRIVTTPLTDAEADSFHAAMRPMPTVTEPSVRLIQELREAAEVAYRGPKDTDPAMLRLYADKIRRGYPGGGSNLTAAVARVLDVVADALLWQPIPAAEPSVLTREQIDSAVGAVLFNAGNYPRPAVPHILGQDIAPLRTKVTDAVLALLSQPTPIAAVHFCTLGCTEANCPVEPFTAEDLAELREVIRSRPGLNPSTIRDVTPPAVTS